MAIACFVLLERLEYGGRHTLLLLEGLEHDGASRIVLLDRTIGISVAVPHFTRLERLRRCCCSLHGPVGTILFAVALPHFVPLERLQCCCGSILYPTGKTAVFWLFLAFFLR